MEFIVRLLISLLLVAAVTAVIACLAIYNCKRRQQTRPAMVKGAERTAAEKTQPTPIEETQAEVAPEPQPIVAGETEPTAVEETQPTPVEETQAEVAPEPQPIVAGETEPTAVEETQPTPVEETQAEVAPEPQPIVAGETEPTAVEETQPTPVEETQAEVAPEPQPIVPRESQPTIGVETKPAAVEEAQPIEEEFQPTLTEEAQPTVVEEAEPTASEKTKPTITKEAQPQARDDVSQKAEGGRRKPEKRGGRPRSRAQGHAEGPTQGPKQHRPKPEIVCWKRERQWILGIEIPEDLLANPTLAVLQDRLPLTQDEFKEGFWHLREAYGQVVVQWNEDEITKEFKIALGKESYLLFKLTGQDQREGRHVKSASSGSYLVIVPEDWQRDKTLSGPPPVTPEPVSLPGYRAHFFELEKGGDGKIAFRLANGNSCIIESKASRFELVGTCLNDATEGMGPLFGVSPPRICARDDRAWEDIGTVVVGEEGSKRGRWRTQITPAPDVREQDLPAEVAATKGGWYFLRFYDTNDDLIESMDFRFISALREIRIHQPPPLPSENGHTPVRVELLHEPGCVVEPADGSTSVRIERQHGQTSLIIPRDPTCDETRLLVGPADGPRVEVTLLVERLWWTAGEEEKEPLQWEDQPFTLSRDDFAATSRRALWFRFPRRRWVNQVFVGFEQAKVRPYNVKVTDKTIAIPFREFGDSEELADHMHEYSLKVWIERNGRFIEGIVALIPASQPEVPYWIGFGRKKTAVAKVVLQLGSGEMTVNGQPLDDYLKKTPIRAKRFLQRLLELRQVREALSQLSASITVTGSSPTTTRQAKAVAHALARALMNYAPALKASLKRAGFGGVRVKKRPARKERGRR